MGGLPVMDKGKANKLNNSTPEEIVAKYAPKTKFSSNRLKIVLKAHPGRETDDIYTVIVCFEGAFWVWGDNGGKWND